MPKRISLSAIVFANLSMKGRLSVEVCGLFLWSLGFDFSWGSPQNLLEVQWEDLTDIIKKSGGGY